MIKKKEWIYHSHCFPNIPIHFFHYFQKQNNGKIHVAGTHFWSSKPDNVHSPSFKRLVLLTRKKTMP